MEKKELNRKIKVHCPTHGGVFEIDAAPQITCDTVEHSLSNDFPNSEYWEYCCDCQTFTPSNFGVGGKARSTCFNCERKIIKFFVCNECKIISYDSNENTKGKLFKLDAKDGILPNCVGCHKSFTGINIYQHKCEDIEGSYLSCRKECPFCLKPVLIENKIANISKELATPSKSAGQIKNHCPKCNSTNPKDAPFCGNCGKQSLTNVSNIKLGTSQAKTMLLGSICPNCGAGNNGEFPFCGNCGQALKTKSDINTTSNSNTNSLYPDAQVSNNSIEVSLPTNGKDEKKSNSNIVYSVIVIAIVSFGAIILASIGLNKTTVKRGNLSTNVSDTNPKDSNEKMVDGDKNTSPLIRRKGHLTTNVNIRTESHKFSQLIGTHYEDAKIEVLDIKSYYSNDNEYVTWYKVKILEDGYNSKTNNEKGNNWERDGNFGWMEAKKIGWMNSKYISLD